jgi:glycine C-acetyltransferase
LPVAVAIWNWDKNSGFLMQEYRMFRHFPFLLLFLLVLVSGNILAQNDELAYTEELVYGVNFNTNASGGGILVITEGVFGMAGDQGKIKEIVEFRKSGKYDFRLFVDDAHGFGAIGATGRGAGEAQGVMEEIDVLFGTFAKAMASIGGFICANESVVEYLRYNMRSQMFAKSLPMPIVIGALKRLELLKTKPELREKLATIAHALQSGLREAGFDIGHTNSPVTPVFLKGAGNLAVATNLTYDLRENYQIFCSIVTYPVVPKDVIMLRLIPTAVHTLEDVRYTIETFVKCQDKLTRGEYASENLATVETDK